jgi:hypothetical protein
VSPLPIIASPAADDSKPQQLAAVTAAAVIALRSLVLNVVVRSSQSFMLEAALARGFSNGRECCSRGFGLLVSLC